MLGTDKEPGIYVRTLNDLFKAIEETSDDMQYSVSMSYLEVRIQLWELNSQPNVPANSKWSTKYKMALIAMLLFVTFYEFTFWSSYCIKATGSTPITVYLCYYMMVI